MWVYSPYFRSNIHNFAKKTVGIINKNLSKNNRSLQIVGHNRQTISLPSNISMDICNNKM